MILYNHDSRILEKTFSEDINADNTFMIVHNKSSFHYKVFGSVITEVYTELDYVTSENGKVSLLPVDKRRKKVRFDLKILSSIYPGIYNMKIYVTNGGVERFLYEESIHILKVYSREEIKNLNEDLYFVINDWDDINIPWDEINVPWENIISPRI